MYYKYMREKQRGFTLIELLVSISIIAILTALLTANFIGARQRGRDGQRKANLFQIQSALELYRSDNGVYPVGNAFPVCGSALSYTNPNTSAVTTYMQKVPCDPSTDDPYVYTSVDGTSYTLFACLENEQDSDKDTDPADANVCSSSSSNVPFKLTNP
jgi:type II secretion system protein G